ncbi:hypothetical protein K450DRAFT_240248 [Umbelopsis ramanniana AG]|uniref:Uncharacterized protein n=1 Tax=Umbelopsis ramanniana AG TaxID=1314678 RepID=A0AAD5EBC2_UMBRA|nr:uncharacterized protein K450DRAFT_240248 [Umbelopsis ramanniana AG]KAI8579770.1 hypothetical protein K450DRAFT_240248 [Umbelopsis ramanniana AG]
MRLFADNKSTKLQKKLQQEEQLLFAQEQARKRAQIEEDEKLAKELQAQESRSSRQSSTGSASPPPLPARPPKPLAYHPEYLPRVKSDPAVTTPTTHKTMPFGRIRTTSTPTVVDISTFPPRSPARSSPTGPQPNSSGRSSPPSYPPTISPSPPPTRPTSTQVYQSISTIPPKPPASAPPTYPRRDPVMFIVPTPHSNTAPALPPAPRPEPMSLPPSNSHYLSSPPQNSYSNDAYNEYQDFSPSQQEYYHYQPLQANQQENSSSSYTPVYANQQEWKYNENNRQKAQPQLPQNEWAHPATAQSPHNEWAHQATPLSKPGLSQFTVGKPDDVRDKQLVEVKRSPSKIQTVATRLGDSDSDSDDYSDFVIRVGPMAHKKMVEEKSSVEPVRSEKSQDEAPSSQSKEQEDQPIDLVDPFADTNAIEKDSESPNVVVNEGSSYFTSKAVHPADQGEFNPSGANNEPRPSLSVAADIQRPESAANFRQMQARLNALLNGNPDQSKTIHESPDESIKIENEDEAAEPDEKVEMAHEVTVASVNTPALYHSPLHHRSKSTPPEQFSPMTRTPQPYTRTTQPPKLLRPPIPMTPKPIPSRSKSVPESPTTDARRNTIAEPPLYPPTITPSLPPAMLQGDVLAGIPHNEFGFYRVDTPVPGTQVLERKALPQTPPNLPKEKSENRHITCKLPKHFTAGHRVWIAIKPSDTGKTLAHRIHVVATLRTMKITGIKTAAGREVPLDNTPVFPTWQEIETFHDGELWTFETGGEPENILIQGGKDWFKQIVTNMRD